MLISFVRTCILYILVVFSMRFMGKRQIGQLQPFELAAALMISELAALPMQNTGVPLTIGIIPILTLLTMQLTLSFVTMKSMHARELFCGKPRVIIIKGNLMQENMMKEMYTINDLLEQLRMKDYTELSDVDYAILEPNGELSILYKPEKRPLKPDDINVHPPALKPPVELIIDGHVLKDNLKMAGIAHSELISLITAQGAGSAKDVFFAFVDSSGNFRIQLAKKSEEILSEVL